MTRESTAGQQVLFRNGGSEAVMFHERDFLRDSGVEVIDFSMNDARNLPSPYIGLFVGSQAYRGDLDRGPISRVHIALKLIHSSEAVRNIERLIDRTRPDLVHCHNIYHQLTRRSLEQPSGVTCQWCSRFTIISLCAPFICDCETERCVLNAWTVSSIEGRSEPLRRRLAYQECRTVRRGSGSTASGKLREARCSDRAERIHARFSIQKVFR